ncbi:class I SAM-dependent methyltransferase [Desulfotomaculum copahuensis]|uniref:Methyltransferase type 11 n=1 Tax=Desulfotomaculum copahuensis TaxID=1838280 RepID=A0A1B7LIR4_9FIRM|nr:class I SAM-dependent methyltransferase [Desulfotomaculum copahuensis]OAT86361.1 methyltransferase type 11 [Desulfotomaculum copahuensis]
MNNIYDNKQFFYQYSKMSRSQQGLSGAGEWHQFKALFPELSGKSVLDLGCGYGWHCKYAVECGAEHVMGIDLSEKMINEAKEKNADPKITYRICGLEEYYYPADSYDCVISNLVLHYIADIDAIFRKVYSTLKNSGIFLINIEHPVFTTGVNQDWVYDSNGKPQYWPVDNYFYSGERATHFLGQNITKQHHTLTQILMGLINAGFRLEAVEEAMPSNDMMEIPGMSDEMRRPMMLLIKSVKQA